MNRLSVSFVVLFAGGLLEVAETGANSGTPAIRDGDQAAAGVVAAPRKGELAFNYLVPGFGDSAWNTVSFFPSVQQEFEKDLAVLASLGVKHVKIFFDPHGSGMRFKKDAGADLDGDAMKLAASVLPIVLQKCAAYGIRPIVCFMVNNYYLQGPNGFYPNGNKPNWYDYSFAHWGEEEGAARFGATLAEWENAIVRAIEATPEAKHVLYYNVFTELSYGFSNYASKVTSGMFRRILADVHVPNGKLAADAYPGFERNGLLMKADLKAAGHKLDWTEVHLYPTTKSKENTGDWIEQTRAMFPGTRVVLGEFGADFTEHGANQGGVFMKILDEAAKHDSMLINWNFWDYHPRAQKGGGRFGLGFSRDDPRDILGSVVDRFSALPNGDFESEVLVWSLPSGSQTGTLWGNPVPLGGKLGRLTRATGKAATGKAFLHLSTDKGLFFFVRSQAFPVTGSRLAMNAYLRASDPVGVRVHYRDKAGWSYDRKQYVPQRHTARLATEAWTALQDAWDGFVFELPREASEICVDFILDTHLEFNADKSRFLDIDTVSVQTFSPLE